MEPQTTFPALATVSSRSSTAGGTVEALAQELSAHKQLLERYASNPEGEEFLDGMTTLLKFVGSYADRSVYEEFERTDSFPGYQSFFHACLLRFAIALEEMSLRELLLSPHIDGLRLGQQLIPRAIPSYMRMENTLQLADHDRCAKYVMVGIGRVPFSLFYLHDFTNIPSMVGIDNNSQAISKCQRVVDAYALNRIQVECVDGMHYHFADADVIYVACFANPKAPILERIATTAKRDCQIIIQVPEFTGTLLNEQVSLDDRFVVRAQSQVPSSWMLNHLVAGLR